MTKAKEALNEMPDGCDIHDATDWLEKHGKTIRKALELLDKVESGGNTLSNDYVPYRAIKEKYILIPREIK